MGHIWDDHGNIAIETRSESFIIHPNYGYTYQLDALKEVKVGDWFYFQKEGQPDGLCCQLTSVALETDGYVRTYRQGDDLSTVTNGNLLVIWCYGKDQPNREKQAEGSFARTWRDNPHPEFENEDLPALIEALQEIWDDDDWRRGHGLVTNIENPA